MHALISACKPETAVQVRGLLAEVGTWNGLNCAYNCGVAIVKSLINPGLAPDVQWYLGKMKWLKSPAMMQITSGC